MVWRIALLLLCMIASASAAESRITWVSELGTDASPNCAFATPCRSFAGAQEKTLNGGIIMCRESGFFGRTSPNRIFRITRSLTIDCTGHTAMVDSLVMDGVNLIDGRPLPNAADIVVIVRGVTFYGGFRATEVNIHGGGIAAQIGNALHIENCRITGFANHRTSIAGIAFQPTRDMRLQISDTIISGNGNGNAASDLTGAGLFIRPFGAGNARVTLTRVQVHQNTHGIAMETTNGVGGVEVTVIDSVSSHNINDGIRAISRGDGDGTLRVTLDNVRAVNNADHGIRAEGEKVTVRVSNALVAGNATGVAHRDRATLLSARNNLVERNEVDGVFSGTFALK